MNSIEKYYYIDLLRAYLENELNKNGSLGDLIKSARKQNLDIHFLKRLDNPRLKHCLGIARNLMPRTLLDIGSGKGFFLWGMLEVNPEIKITAVDTENALLGRIAKVAKYADLAIKTTECNAEDIPFKNNSFEMVSMLEVLEHTQNPEKMVEEAVRVSNKWVLLSVPAKEDDNPEHIHLFTKEKLEKLFDLDDIESVKIEHYMDRFYLIAKKKEF